MDKTWIDNILLSESLHPVVYIPTVDLKVYSLYKIIDCIMQNRYITKLKDMGYTVICPDKQALYLRKYSSIRASRWTMNTF